MIVNSIHCLIGTRVVRSRVSRGYYLDLMSSLLSETRAIHLPSLSRTPLQAAFLRNSDPNDESKT